jgi:hypothetical protein
MEAMNSSRSCPVGFNLRHFKSQAGAFWEFPMLLSKHSSSTDKGAYSRCNELKQFFHCW